MSAVPAPSPPSVDAASLAAGLFRLQRDVAHLSAAGPKDEGWPAAFDAVASRIADVVAQDRDTVLYMLAQDAQRNLGSYSSRHALYCAVVALLCATELGWPEAELRLLVCSALSMNLGMSALQDELTFRERTPTLDQRRVVDEHPALSADLLRQAGVVDELWLEVVSRHHETQPVGVPLADLEPARRIAALLHRADVFTAKLSARQARAAMRATAAARDACLGPDGRPDEIGAAVVKALGIYPPGSYVKLASGEVGVVKRRGSEANEPLVLSLIGRDGRPLPTPIARHTGQSEHAVRSAAQPIVQRLLAEHLRAATHT